MPLSEHEQRLLEQMERALYAEDPKFASALEGSGLRAYTRRRVYRAAAGFVVGVALLVAGVIQEIIWVSVAGFLVMLGSAAFGFATWRRTRPLEERAAQQERAQGVTPFDRRQRRKNSVTPLDRRQRRKNSVMDRIEERWQRRRDEQGL